jgi:DNA mismatch repair ATPase MutL
VQLIGRLNRLDERRGCDGDVAVVRQNDVLHVVSLSRARETVCFEKLRASASVMQQELSAAVQLSPSSVPPALWPVLERRHEPAVARALRLNGFSLRDGAGESTVELTHVAVRDSSSTAAPLASLVELLRLIAESDDADDVRQLRTSETLRLFCAEARAAGSAANDERRENDDALLRALLRVRPDFLSGERNGRCPHEHAIGASFAV